MNGLTLIDPLHHSLLDVALVALLELAVMARILLRPHRDPASRIAWVLVVGVLPLLGMVAYLLLGEVNIGRRRVDRLQKVLERMPPYPHHSAGDVAELVAAIPERYRHLFQLGRSISGFDPVGGNTAHLLSDSNATIDVMVVDIDGAKDHVHVLFYIWLPDHNGRKVVEALKRAAIRGVTCRAMADDLGSRTIIRSEHWKAVRAAGVRVAVGLPIGNLLLRPFRGRIDLRNHRKIVVIDDRITYCGSQNCADPEFLVKKKYAPLVDAVMRFEGPITRQNQFLFASDWMTFVQENLDDLLSKPLPLPMSGGALAQVIGTGPTVRYSAMPEMFESLMYAARRELVVTTPYYVPDESLQNALCTTAYRGVDTTIVFPSRNDSWIVGAASRSYYTDLLAAGVKIYEVESPSNRGVDRLHLPTSLDNALAYVLWRLIQAGTGKKSDLRRCGLCRRFFFSSEESGDGAPPNRSRRCACQAQAAPSSVAEQRSDRTGDERAPALQRRRREFSRN